MTTTELCELFSAEIANTFDGNKELIKEQLFNGTTTDMTEEQIYSRMALNSIISFCSSSCDRSGIVRGNTKECS